MKKILMFFIMLFSLSVFSKEFETSKDLITGTLPNGLTYYIYKNKKPEKKSIFNLVVKAGSMQEEDGDQGIAHIIEHMAFNGTKKYKKNDMIRYLQSIGLDFGGDLNAYTSFEETVYKLILPTDDNKKFETGIEILREWANEVTFDKNELESEKKVVLEEWRLHQGLSQRLEDIRKKALLSGTRYYDRFPIGTVETIKKATSESLKRFYNKWYQPQNMVIVAVGDFDVKKTEALIKKYFNYKPKAKYTAPEKYTINKLSDKFLTFKDPEIPMTTFYMTRIANREIATSSEAYKRMNIDILMYGIINTRISRILTEKDVPISDGIMYNSDFNISHDMITFAVASKDDTTKDSITLAENILRSTAKDGFTQVELDQEKRNNINSFKNLYANKDSIPHERYADEIIRHALTGESFIGIDKEYQVFNDIMKTITVDDLNKRIKEIYDEGTLYFITGPSKSTNMPNEEALKQIIAAAKTSSNSITFDTREVTLPPLDVSKGSITSSKDGMYTLSNGITVATKKTNFDKDKIFIRFFKTEGTSNSTYEEFLNSIFACDIVANSGVHDMSPKDIDSYMKGKNFSLSPYIGDYEQGFEIATDNADLSDALEYMNYMIREPKLDDGIFTNVMADAKESIANRNNSPSRVYQDEINKTYSNNFIRRLPMTYDELNKISKEKIMSVYKDKFDNFNGFHLIIVGAFDETKLPELLEKYFASLPSNNTILKAKKLDIDTPKNIVTKTVTKGTDKKATVTFIFPYNYKYGENERIMYAALSRLLTMSLTTDIREELGGTYSINSYPSLSPNNYGEDRIIIRFSCDTKRLNEIKRAVLNTIKRVISTKPNKELIDSIAENFALSYKTDVLLNGYWTNYFYQKMTIGDSFKIPTPAEYRKIVTPNNLLNFSKKAINMQNYIDVTLVPEKEE